MIPPLAHPRPHRLRLREQVVVWLPALCRKMGIPYAVVKGKSRLGQVVHKKTATCLALTSVNKEDQQAFNKLVESITTNFNERADTVSVGWQLKRRARQLLVLVLVLVLLVLVLVLLLMMMMMRFLTGRVHKRASQPAPMELPLC